MVKSTEWNVFKSIDEDCEELIAGPFYTREYAEEIAGEWAQRYLGDYFLVYGNNASSPCWMSW